MSPTTDHHGRRSAEAIEPLLALAPVIPVLTIENAEDAEPLARALLAGGLPLLEVTLRSEAALEAIARMARIEGLKVAAGTVLDGDAAREARKAGALFAVSPGHTEALLEGCAEAGLPLLPGAATASEAMALLARGYRLQKFFPASIAGGPAALRALAAPLPQIGFCPTGGIGAENAHEYLSLPNVRCVGGSWVAPRSLIAIRAWPEIEALARAAAALGR